MTVEEASNVLDQAYSMLMEGNIPAGMKTLETQLREVRRSVTADEWIAYSTRTCRQHPVCSLLLQDPFTRRSFEKPRNYPGDAELLDFAYRWPSVNGQVKAASELGQAIYAYAVQTTAATAVRDRLQTVVARIDSLARSKALPDILSIACGHLREAHISKAVQELKIGRFVALDQDPETINRVAEELSNFKIEPIVASLRGLLRGSPELGKFDFIYAIGLYDYLQPPLARRLTAKTFAMLRPGGKLLVANFMPEIFAVGYMECFMDWQLTYRNRTEMSELAEGIPAPQIDSTSVSVDKEQCIAYLELTKRL